MDPPSDAEVIGRSLGEPEVFGLIYDNVADVDAHYQRAVAAGARIAKGLPDHLRGDRAYEALDLEGHRWRFRQQLREVPSTR